MAKPTTHVLDQLTSDIDPARPEGQTERLVRHMRSWVSRGLIEPGTRLPSERDLAAMLQVSRASLREALKALEVMGVVEARHGSGTYLTEAAAAILQQPKTLLMPLHGVSFGELFETRRAIEAEAAAGAAMRATMRDIDALAQELKKMRQTLAEPVRYHVHDMAFHRKVAVASGNSVFVWFLDLAIAVMARAFEARARAVPLDDTCLEHEAILDAVARGDAEGARMAMLTHLVLAKFYGQGQMIVELRLTASAERRSPSRDTVP